MKMLLPVLILALVALLSGCMEQGGNENANVNAEEVKALMIDAAGNVSAYRYSMNSVIGARTINISDDDVLTEMNIKTSREDVWDYPARRMHTLGSRAEDVTFEGGDDTSSEETEIYIVNDTVYARFNDNWTKSDLPEENARLIWEQDNLVTYQAELLNRSDLEFAGSDEIDGISCDKYTVTPSIDTFYVILNEQLGTLLPLPYMNLEELYNETDVQWTACISGETNLLYRSDIEMDLDITPEIMGPLAAIVGNTTTSITLQSSSLFSDFNEPQEIVLPPEALDAEEIPISPAGMEVTTVAAGDEDGNE